MDDPKKQLESLINKGFNRKAGTINLATMKKYRFSDKAPYCCNNLKIGIIFILSLNNQSVIFPLI